ncbi:MAG: phage head-tail connector protein [Clostridia bacterium]|nr:phage head-tail connector protein [Clostridia bacterium]
MLDPLKMLKSDLRILHDKEDEYLNFRISAAKKEIEREGIKLDLDEVDHVLIVSDYAAWLYRKRSQEIAFPQNLRTRMNKLLISQKAGKKNG